MIVLSSLFAVVCGLIFAAPTAEAKRPGSTYCFVGKCHRVKTISEMQRLIGQDVTLYASHYSDCSKDRYNPCGLTSSGARFEPERPDNAASPIYPDGTRLLIWNPATKAAALVRIDNAGPYWGNRKLDVSHATAESLGFRRAGVAKLKTRVIAAPTRSETSYRKYRKYDPVAGYFGKFDSIDDAEHTLAAVMAVRAMAASSLAPVAAAAVASSHAEPVQAADQRRKLANKVKARIASVETLKTRTNGLLLADAAVSSPRARPPAAQPARRPDMRVGPALRVAVAPQASPGVPLPGRKASAVVQAGGPTVAYTASRDARAGAAAAAMTPPVPVRVAALTTPLPELSPQHRSRRIAQGYQAQTDGRPVTVASRFRPAIPDRTSPAGPPLPELGPARWRIKAASLPPLPAAKPTRVAALAGPDTLDDLAWELEQVLIDRHFRRPREAAIDLMDDALVPTDLPARSSQPRSLPASNGARAGRMG